MDEESAMERVPVEILLIIFQYVKAHHLGINAAKVCRRWKQLISHYVLWIQDSGDEEKMHTRLTALLVTSYIPALSETSVLVNRVVTMLPHLKELTISAQYCLNPKDYIDLAALKNLRHLDVFAQNDVLDKNTSIPTGITSLVVNNNMISEFLRPLIKGRRILRAFHMYGKSFYYRCSELAMLVGRHSVHLTELTLRCADSPEIVYTMIGKCTALRSLQLYSCLQLTPSSTLFLTGLTQLRRLHLTGMRMIRVDRLYSFIERLPRLVVDLNLSYSWFGDEHCGHLLARLPHLRSLELWRCRVSAYALLQLTKFLFSLEELDTDVHFIPANIRELNEHSSLKKLRCRYSVETKTKFDMKSATDTIPAQYLRANNSEGPQSELFYYWTQGVAINTLPVSPNSWIPIRSDLALSRTNDSDFFDWPRYEGFPTN